LSVGSEPSSTPTTFDEVTGPTHTAVTISAVRFRSMARKSSRSASAKATLWLTPDSLNSRAAAVSLSPSSGSGVGGGGGVVPTATFLGRDR
jgi:hypothetical protein